MLVRLVEKWLEENDIQHMRGGEPNTLAVSARCWDCAHGPGRFVDIEEDGPQVVIRPAFSKPITVIQAADPQLFPKLLAALNRCEHMIRGGI